MERPQLLGDRRQKTLIGLEPLSGKLPHVGDVDTSGLIRKSSQLRKAGALLPALECAQKACAAAKYDAAPWHELALVSDALGYTEEAADAYFHAADAHARAGKTGEAITLLDTALARSPQHGPAGDLRSMLKRRMISVRLAQGTATGNDPEAPKSTQLAPRPPKMARGSSNRIPQVTHPETTEYTRAAAVANVALENHMLASLRSDGLTDLAEHADLVSVTPEAAFSSRPGTIYFVRRGTVAVTTQTERWQCNVGELVDGDELIGLSPGKLAISTQGRSSLLCLPADEYRQLAEQGESSFNAMLTHVYANRQKRMLSNHPAFAGCDDDARKQLMRIAQTQPINDGDLLFEQGDPCVGLYLILVGQFDVSTHNGPTRQRDHTAGPGDLLGAGELLGGKRMKIEAAATSPGAVTRISREPLLRLAAQHPLLLEALSRLS